MKTVTLLVSLILITSAFDCIQNPEVNFEANKTTVWKPESRSYKVEKYRRKTIFIFEGNFDDTLQIDLADKRLYKTAILTNRSVNRVIPTFEIDSKQFSNKDSIKIFLIKKQVATQFQIMNGYKYLYIQRLSYNGRYRWSLEYSNYPRDYY